MQYQFPPFKLKDRLPHRRNFIVPSQHLDHAACMSDKESDDEMHDADRGSPEAAENGDVVKYGELNVSGPDSVAAGVAAGNIHLQSTDAATLALPEASGVSFGHLADMAPSSKSVCISMIQRHRDRQVITNTAVMFRAAKKQESSRKDCWKPLRSAALCERQPYPPAMRTLGQLFEPLQSLSHCLESSR